jgi:hypothetical protein
MRRTNLHPALATGLGATLAAAGAATTACTARAQSVDFKIIDQSCSVDLKRAAVTFSVTFDRAPDFSNVHSRQANTFQYEIDADGSDFARPLDFTDVDSVIRGGEIWEGHGLPIRDRDGIGDDNSGGWGPVRALVPYELEGQTLNFTVGLSAINDTDGHFRYRLFTTEDGGLTSETVGAAVPLPLGAWTSLGALAGLGLIRRFRKAAL